MMLHHSVAVMLLSTSFVLLAFALWLGFLGWVKGNNRQLKDAAIMLASGWTLIGVYYLANHLAGG